MPDVMIRVPAEVRDRLAAVAEARGTSLRAPMPETAAQTLTPDAGGHGRLSSRPRGAGVVPLNLAEHYVQ